MNTIVTSKEAILAKCRQLVAKQGISAVNMRTVANSCGIAVGSLYNYFPSKTDLITAAVEDVWHDIFHLSEAPPEFESFPECLARLFETVKKGCAKYPGFFTFHSVSFAAGDREQGRHLMEHCFGHMKEHLIHVLDQDPGIRPDAFSEKLTKEAFLEFIFTAFTSMLLKGQTDCDVLLEIAARCIYSPNIYEK